MRPFSAIVIGCATVTAAVAQDLPRSRCDFDGFGGDHALAQVSDAKSNGYTGCSTSKDCLPLKLAPSDLVVVYRVDRDWTCGYVAQRKGAGPGWVRSAQLRPIAADPAPSLKAWVATWINGEDHIQIRPGKTVGQLELEGDGTWRGNKSVHEGNFAGVATPQGNHLHFVEDGADSCTIDLTLIGPYLVADDNERCGGANVRFWGVWTHAAK